jgi:hypothetical protein
MSVNNELLLLLEETDILYNLLFESDANRSQSELEEIKQSIEELKRLIQNAQNKKV